MADPENSPLKEPSAPSPPETTPLPLPDETPTPPENSPGMLSETLHYENARAALQVFNNNPANLALLEREFGVRVTSRDGWIKVWGPTDSVATVCNFLRTLEKSILDGAPIRNRDFAQAARLTRAEGIAALRDLQTLRLRTSPKKPPIAARTRGQLAYLKAIAEHDVTFGIGPAGTGKTYLAMAMAVMALRENQVDRIILTRPAVEAGEALGYLPGDLYEKIAPYLRPLHDALYDMLPPDDIQRYQERGIVEIAPLAYMRGRTLNHAFIILDEAQNATAEQMFMFLTRLGHESKAVITGDPTQIDLRPSRESGIIEAERALANVDGVALVRFTRNDVVRHPLVQRIIAAYESHRNPHGHDRS